MFCLLLCNILTRDNLNINMLENNDFAVPLGNTLTLADKDQRSRNIVHGVGSWVHMFIWWLSNSFERLSWRF